MNDSLLKVAVISISVGVLGGILIAIFVKLVRRKQRVDSLIRPDHIIGLFGTVEIPFDRDSKGKIRVNIKGSIVDFIAMTDRPHAFNQGDKVFVVEIKNNRAWVIPTDYLKAGCETEDFN